MSDTLPSVFFLGYIPTPCAVFGFIVWTGFFVPGETLAGTAASGLSLPEGLTADTFGEMIIKRYSERHIEQYALHNTLPDSEIYTRMDGVLVDIKSLSDYFNSISRPSHQVFFNLSSPLLHDKGPIFRKVTGGGEIMSFTAVIKTCLTRGFINFQGRASREEYWCFLFFCLLMWCCGSLLLELLEIPAWLVPEETQSLIDKAGAAAAFLLLPPFCAVHVRRLHDMNRSGLRLLAMGALLLLCYPLIMYAFWVSILGNNMDGNIKVSFEPVAALGFFVRRIVFAAGTLAENAQMVEFMLSFGKGAKYYGILFSLMAAGYTFFNLLLWGIFATMSRRGVDEDNRYGPAPVPLHINPAGRDFLSSLHRCLGHGYIRFQGRAPRSEYWWFSFAQTLVCNAWFFSLGGARGLWNQSSWSSLLLSVLLIFLPLILLFLPGLSVTVRRLHDREKSGSWLVVLLVTQCLLTILAVRIAFHSYGYPDAKTILFLSCLVLAPHLLLLYQMVRRGTGGRNAYGPDPLEQPGMTAGMTNMAAHTGHNSSATSR